MKRKTFILLLLLFPALVSAKNVDDLIFRWESFCNIGNSYDRCVNRNFVNETNDSIIISTSTQTLESYNKQTGEIKAYDSETAIDYEKIGNSYLVLENIYNDDEIVSKFVLLDSNLNVLKEKELSHDSRYFYNLEYVDNELILVDNGSNAYSIDNDLNITSKNKLSDGSYVVYSYNYDKNEAYVIKFDSNHKEIKRQVFEEDYGYNTDYVRKDNYYLYINSDSVKWDYKYIFYLVDENADIVDTYEIIVSSRYNNLHLASNNEIYTTNSSISYKISIDNEKIVLVAEDAPKKDNNVVVDSDKIEFEEILNKEIGEFSDYSFEYEKLENNYFALYVTWYDYSAEDTVKIYEFRYYDSSKKLLIEESYKKFDDLDKIYDSFLLNNNLGFLALIENNFYLVFLDENFNVTSKINTKFSNLDFNGGFVKILNNGIYVKFYEIMGTPCGIESVVDSESTMLGFPDTSAGYCKHYSNVGFQYYEFPFLIETKTDGNGTLVSSKKISDYGEEITFTVQPNKGYTLEKVIVTDKNGNVVTFTDNTFTMPSADVIIEATFLPENPPTSDLIVMIVSFLGIFCLIICVLSSKKMEFLN